MPRDNRKERALMQKYRADSRRTEIDGSVTWFSDWIGGPSLARINNCRLALAGDMRRSVYITGEPDTYFSQPAVCRIQGCVVKGYVTRDEAGYIFQPVYYA